MKIGIFVFILMFCFCSTAFSNNNDYIDKCKDDLTSNFHKSVDIDFPNPLVYDNDEFMFVHYKDDYKITTGDGNIFFDVRCTIHKKTKIITFMNINGKDKTKPYDYDSL